MTTIKLRNGIEMPIIGLGTWQSTNEEGIKAIHEALNAGYRSIDTASAYKNEEEVGRALEEYFKTGKLSRKDVFITTKLWCNSSRPEDVEPTLRKQLAALRTDYVDLYLIHHPTAYTKDMSAPEHSVKPEDTWKAMEQIYHKGLAKSIGISNFNEAQIERVLEVAKVPIHNHQIEVHLYFQQHKLVDFCQQKGITVTAYAPIGSPGRTTFELPNGKTTIWPEGVPDPLKEPYVHELGQKYGKSPAQILLKYLIQRNIAVVPKSSNPKRIKENIDIFDFQITADEMEKLNSLDKNFRIFFQSHYIGHPDDPWKDERE